MQFNVHAAKCLNNLYLKIAMMLQLTLDKQEALQPDVFHYAG